MLDSIIVFLSAVIGSLSGVVGAYVMLKKYGKSDVFIEILEDFVTDLSENAEMQKRIYIIGGILGNGIRQGVGIGKTKGKFKLEDLIMQVIGGYIQNKVMPQQTQGQETPINPLLNP